MLIYGYKGEKSPNSIKFYSSNNQYNLFRYNRILYNELANDTEREIWLKQVYNTYSVMCRFNNWLVSAYNTEKEPLVLDIAFLKEYLEKNKDILESKDNNCVYVYRKLDKWYQRLNENISNLDIIKWEVVKEMKYFEQMGLFHIASINQQKNYDDFCL